MSCALCRQCEVELSVGLVGVRLAAFVEWPESAALGWEPSEFAHVYADNRAVAVHEVVEDNPLAKAVGVMAERAERWTGAAGALLPLLDARVSDAAKKQRSPIDAGGPGQGAGASVVGSEGFPRPRNRAGSLL